MLKHLELTNFRNYNKFSLDFAKTTILVGPNGIGKTNILEAIYLLATGRSWRTNKDSEAVKRESDFTKIKAIIQNDREKEIELIIQRLPTLERPQLKLVKINKLKKKLTDLLGVLRAVLFSPEEIHLIDGPPTLRRRFLDILLCQIDKKYTYALLELAKIIRGRNKLLYFIKIGKSKIDELVFWDEKLIILSSFLIGKRKSTIEKLNGNISRFYQEISGTREALMIKYRPGAEVENFKRILEENQKREIEKTATLFGPHRDDLVFLLENQDITTFGSRGEYRSIVLALKMAELEFLTSETGEKPLLLLDDIFSELDKTRREHLAGIIGKQQTIITTTDLDHIEKELREKGKIIELSNPKS